MVTSTPWSLCIYIYIFLNLKIIFFEQADPSVVDDSGFFPPPPLKVPQLLSNLFISVINNNEFFFPLFVKSSMTFFEFNQCC